MAEPDPRPKLGDILTRLQLIDDDQVRAALDHQSSSGKLFGESLLDLGFIGQDDLSWALSSQLGLPYVAVSTDMADPGLLVQFPQEFLRKNLVLPLVASESTLSVVLADPTDRTVLARLERIAGRELNVAVGTPSAIRAALSAALGTEEGATGLDLVKLPARTPPPSLSSPELATLVDRALSHGASLVHLDPEGEEVRVRFRDASGVLQEGGSFEVKTIRELVRGLTDWLGAGSEDAPGISVWGEIPEQAENLPFRVIALSSDAGTSLTLVLEGIAPGGDRLLAGYDDEWSRLDVLLERPTGLLLGVAPTALGGEHLLTRMLGRFDVGSRRACAFVNGNFPLPQGVLRMIGEPTARSVAGVSRVEGLDVLLGTFTAPEVLPHLTSAASRDRLVVATLPGNGALGFLARMIEAGTSATMLAECLLAVSAQQILPARNDAPARAVTETLFVDRPLRRALQNGGSVDSLRQAARDQGFVEIGARIRTLDEIDPAVLAHLERHCYLEDAA